MAVAEATKKETKPKTKTIKPVDFSAKKYEVSLILSPYSNEHIKYTGNHKPQSLSSFYGFGAGLSFNYNIEENYGIGSRFFYQWHEFKDFHIYNEFKLDVSVRYKVFTSQNLRFKLYLSHSIGADFVLRDDEDKCIYALFGIIGIQEDVMLSNEVSLNWGTDVSFTFQNGSSVLHFTPYLGVTYHWGKDA